MLDHHHIPANTFTGSQAGKAKSSRETQGLNENRDSLNTVYVKEFIGSK